MNVGMEVGEEGDYHCHHQNDFCIMMGSDETESHFNVSVGSDKVTRQCPQTTTFLKRGELKRY